MRFDILTAENVEIRVRVILKVDVLGSSYFSLHMQLAQGNYDINFFPPFLAHLI
jgi:hypothetical protein